MKDDGTMVFLIKPQFEAGRDKVGKKGVVRDESVHVEVIEKIVRFAHICGMAVLGLDHSPIRGPEGNIEYLIYMKKDVSKNDKVSGLDEKTAEDLLSEIAGKDEDVITKPVHDSICKLVARANSELN